MSTPGVTGFQATMAVDDGGTGAASGSASTAFDGVTTFSLPSIESEKFDATELAQSDAYMRELPTGLLKLGQTKGEAKFTKANYNRLVALVGKRGYTFVLVSPDDRTATPGPTKLTTTFLGFVSKLDDVKWEKTGQAVIPFEVTVQAAPAFT